VEAVLSTASTQTLQTTFESQIKLPSAISDSAARITKAHNHHLAPTYSLSNNQCTDMVNTWMPASASVLELT
jgi:hypothetical protein